MSSSFESLRLQTGLLHVDENILFNSSPACLYEHALRFDSNSELTDTGALSVVSGAKTGRSPGDKRIVGSDGEYSRGDWAFNSDIWWGKVNIRLSQDSFLINKSRAVDYLNTKERVYVVDAFAGWNPQYRLRIRIICERPYHALFMRNMLVVPEDLGIDSHTQEFLDTAPDFTIFNSGRFPANRLTKGMTSGTSVCVNFRMGEMVILGTEYAGEMKKGILTLMMYKMPLLGQLPLHSSANIDLNQGKLTFFFGLSGTGKTTLSADPARHLIGDDEHVWTEKGVFNIEGGCYAKVIDLDESKEPDIYKAIRFGAVLENVIMDEQNRIVDYHDTSLTENTRCAYPLKYIGNAQIPASVPTHPNAIILLCCDAFGVLPPVSVLNNEQVQYYFISGYTAKVAGTEEGVTEPTATFSACFGAPFLVWHPVIYAEMLAQKLRGHNAKAYLLNTGWVGGKYGSPGSSRISIKYTRDIVDAINNEEFDDIDLGVLPIFNLKYPKKLRAIPESVLNPMDGWKDKAAYMKQLEYLGTLFSENFSDYKDKTSTDVQFSGPDL